MGWWGYSIYDGDETQTLHYNFLEWAKVATEDEIFDGDWLECEKTVVPKDKIPILKKNLGLILKKMKSPKYWNEDAALSWQMLAALLLDNNIKLPKIVKDKAKDATIYLMGEHAVDFDSTVKRRNQLKKFLQKL